jgi:hypothetical protein
MEHNFADWELTKLLPENPYGKLDSRHTPYIFDDEVYGEYIVIFNSNGSEIPDDYECEYMRAWTWDDIRLYLLSNGVKIVEELGEYDLNDVSYLIYVKYENRTKIECIKYLTNVEYKEAVKFCLNLILNE